MQKALRDKVLLAVGIAGAAALSIATDSQAKTSRTYTVVMDNMSYEGMPAGAKVGDTIVWVNRDTVAHTATTRGKGFDVRLQPGQRAKMTLKKQGSYAIYCVYHPAMRTTLKVG